MDILVN